MSDAPAPNGGTTAAAETGTKHKQYDYGGNPLARTDTSDTQLLQAFGGAFQAGAYKAPKTNIANPAPLGLCAFALTTFLLSLLNIGVRGITLPYIVIGPAFAYGGLVQLLAGMWYVSGVAFSKRLKD